MSQKKPAAIEQPRFNEKTMVDSPYCVLLVDVTGQAWWVDPEKRTIQKAKAK